MDDEKKKVKNSIRFWPKYERPRELFLEKGPDYVSDAGLIAILLRSGTKGKDAVSLARDLIKHFGGLRGLLNAKKSELDKINGLGSAKIAQLLAATEITKRQLKEEIIGKNYVESDKDVLEYLSLSDLPPINVPPVKLNFQPQKPPGQVRLGRDSIFGHFSHIPCLLFPQTASILQFRKFPKKKY